MIPQSLQDNPVLERWVSFPTAGKVRVAFGKVEYGQGIATSLAQIAAEELDVAMERLMVVNAASGASSERGPDCRQHVDRNVRCVRARRLC